MVDPVSVSEPGVYGGLEALDRPVLLSLERIEAGHVVANTRIFRVDRQGPGGQLEATFGFAPVPIIVRKNSSRSSPNCNRP